MRLWEALASCPVLGHIQQMLICAIDSLCFLGNSPPQPEQGPRHQCCLGVGNPSITVVPPQPRGLSTGLQQPQAVARPRSPSHPGDTHPLCPSVFTYHAPPFPLGRPQPGQVTLARSTNSLCHRLLICEMVQELPAYLLAGCREGWTSSRELGPRCSPLSPGFCPSHLPWGRH